MSNSSSVGASEASYWQGAEHLKELVIDNIKDGDAGIYSVCCSHPLVIEAAVDQAFADGSVLLIEATANQVNQFGGYTGMRPQDFSSYVLKIAAGRGLSEDRVILGGDHLGPVCWTSDPVDVALNKATELVRGFAEAGFSKIHLDCSMSLQGDPERLDDMVVAERAAGLCAVAEEAASARFGKSGIVYVVGTEVPPPGGADEALHEIEITPAARAQLTLELHRKAFEKHGLADAWQRVIALVAQPGVEFDNSAVIDYASDRAFELKALAGSGTGGIAFEAHSTDYQVPHAFADLVRDHFAVLKVGPGLTFALREALFALSHIEDALVPADARSNLREVCEQRMIAEPRYWQRFYQGSDAELAVLRGYSLSDRIRYYWPDPIVDAAVQRMLTNLNGVTIPLGLLSQFMPEAYNALRAGIIAADPVSLVKAKLRNAIEPYASACNSGARKAA